MKRKVFKFWLYSYLFVLSIPILITLIVLLQSQNMLIKEVRKSNDTLLDQVQQFIDNQVTDIRRLGTQLSFDPTITVHLNRDTYDTAEARFKNMNIISVLRAYTFANGNIHDAYIYMKQNDYAITTTTYMPADDLYTTLHKTLGISFENWQDWVRQGNPGTFLSLNEDTVGAATASAEKPTAVASANVSDAAASNPATARTNGALVYVQSLPLQEMEQSSGTLVVMLNEERFTSAISQIGLANDGAVYVLDSDGHIVMTTGTKTDLAALPLAQMTGQRGFLIESIKGDNAAISYVKSSETEWTYISVIPEQVYLAEVTMLKTLIYLSIVLCLGIGGFIAFWMTRKNYAPIKNMMDFVSSKVKTNLKSMPNEFAILQSFMTESAAIQDEANKKLEEQRVVLRNQFLTRLLKGRVDTASALSHAIEAHDLQFKTDRFAVLLVQIEDFSPLFQTNQGLDAEKKYQFVYLIITNIFGELLADHHDVYFTEIDGMIACLVNTEGNEKEAKKQLLDITSQAKQFIEERFFVRFSVGVSSIHPLWSSIPKCYDEAKESLEYKLVLGSNQVIAYDAIKQPKNEFYYPLDLERQIINWIGSGDYEEAAEILQKVLIANFAEGTLSLQMGKLLMFELLGTMLRAVEQFQLGTREIMDVKSELVTHITNCETMAEMEEAILSFLKTICDYLQQKKKSHNTDLKSRIVEYVLDNLSDLNISLTSIGLEFDINPTYLSRFFKEQTGENFIDFVNQRRVEKTKQLLMDTDEPIQAIAEQCGFANSQSLLRVFKKYEGITPGQFRKSRVG
ncbi:helix-turn-helix domain-containing protein [Paenibacillus sp. GXUN7292]|uniref:helix-turn-helix domain-containing protein n=2 Tax=unclassified Paenibacillus TaxID=185978 RepID=UPI0033737862